MNVHATLWLKPIRRACRLAAFLFFFAIVSLTGARAVSAQTKLTVEDQVKGRYLANIGKFVEWPESVFATPAAPLVIGIVGHYLVGISLSDAIAGKTVHGRKVQVRFKKAGEDLRDCQIVFISASESRRFGQILNTLRGAHVLAIGESDGFLQAGGTLNFVMEGERVRFDADLAAATRENLRISSKLLMMARFVLNGRSIPKASHLQRERTSSAASCDNIHKVRSDDSNTVVIARNL